MNDLDRPRIVRALGALALSSCTLLAAGCASDDAGTTAGMEASPSALPDTTVEPGQDVVLTVWGMSCPKCVTNVDKLLKQVDGVEDVRIDMSGGIVRVSTGDPAPALADLEAAIVRAGFTLMKTEIVGAAS